MENNLYIVQCPCKSALDIGKSFHFAVGTDQDDALSWAVERYGRVITIWKFSENFIGIHVGRQIFIKATKNDFCFDTTKEEGRE